ncbi:MAG: FKBP-type peptidyl-prolyl cis-trans isomerase [Fimbriimonadaceae bacterium]|jgi:peptidylprolyl isomerase|nr:FKBP-type peptidyl-prolyl cis-trans isomerase [Fimbriimonadaceae bacterium]
MRAIFGVGLLAFALFLVGCTPQETDSVNQVKLDPTAVTQIEELQPGTGPKAEKGDILYVRYRGKLKDGKEFDSNIDKPGRNLFRVELGAGGVIEGWQEGLLGIQKGGKRLLTVPPNKGYGAEGTGEIPPRAVLLFEVEAVYMVKKGEEGVYDAKVTAEGTGPEVKRGDTVTVHYTAKYLGGAVIDDTRLARDKQPVKFTVGEREIVSGVEFAVIGMRKGGKKTLTLPPDLVFGMFGNGLIEGNVPIEVEIEVMSVN